MDIQFRQELVKLRKANHLSQEQLAEQLSVTRQTISKWELGDATPDLARIEQIAHLFEIPIEQLLFGIEKQDTLKSMVKNQAKQLFEKDESDKDWHENHRWREWHYKPIQNGWEFLARYYWIVFAFLGMLFWIYCQK